MGNFRILGLAIAAAAALLAVAGAGTASATAVYNGEAKLGVGTSMVWSLESGTKAGLTDTETDPLVECSSSEEKGKITNAGSSTTTVKFSLETTSWGSCTLPLTTIKPGELELHHISGTTNATVTVASEMSFTINTIFFGSCIYALQSGTNVGIITTGIPATRHVHAVAIKVSGVACPDTATYGAKYISTQPSFPGPIRYELA